MVAMSIFVAGLLSLLLVLTSSLNGSFDNRARLTAANLAASDIDEARSLDYFALSSRSYSRTVDGRTYRIVRSVAPTLSSGGDPSTCVVSGSAKQLHKRVSTQVVTDFRGPVKPVRSDTLVKAPVFDPASARGAISFTVLDFDANRVAGAPVTVLGLTGSTDSNGCAFFDGLPAGNHAVTVTKPGFVLASGSTTLTQTVSVSAGQIAAQSIKVYPAATVRVLARVLNGTTPVTGHALPSGLTLSLATPDRESDVRSVLAPQAVTADTELVMTVAQQRSGYDAYFDECSVVEHTASEPSSPRIDMGLVPVTLSLSGSDQSGRAGRTVTAVWMGSGCTAHTYTFPGSTVGASGATFKVAVPPGRWRLRASKGNSTWQTPSFDLVAGSPRAVTVAP